MRSAALHRHEFKAAGPAERTQQLAVLAAERAAPAGVWLAR